MLHFAAESIVIMVFVLKKMNYESQIKSIKQLTQLLYH